MFKIIRKIQHKDSAVAMIEGLLVCVPIWIFFALILHVLSYWETNHFDHVMKLGSAVSERLVSTSSTHLDTGKAADKTSPTNKTKPGFYMEKISGSDDFPVYYYYITDYVSLKRTRRICGSRRYATWMSHPFLKGQNPKDEGKLIQKWYDSMGNKDLNKARKTLLLGS